MSTMIGTADTKMMAIEAELDKIQALLRNSHSKNISKAQKSARLALGFIRSLMEYHKVRPQQTLVAFGCTNHGKSHRKVIT